jgi:PAS domain S-box-containing protein
MTAALQQALAPQQIALQLSVPPWREEDRVAALRGYGILDTPPEPAFDEITRAAALVFKAPIAVVNLIESDRQFFKSEIGLGVRETPVDVSICAHAILQRDLMVVPDTTRDPRFSGNPLVTGEPHLRFYAGASLETPDGLPIGTVCVLDYAPRPEGITPEQGETLKALARAAMAQIELGRTNKALHESERQLRAITESMPQIVWSARPDGYHDYFNGRWYEFTGATPAESEGEGWNPRLHPDDRPRAFASWRQALATGEPYEIEYRFKSWNGDYRWFIGRALPVRDDTGRVERWFGTCTDIHDLKQAEEERRESQERLDLALTAFGTVGTWVWDVKSDRVVSDERFAQVFGVEPQAARTGVPLSVFVNAIHPDDRPQVAETIARTVAEGGDYECEYRVTMRDGTVRWVNARGRCERDAAGQPLRFPGAIVDVTARKQAEAAAAARANLVETLLETAPVAVWFTDDLRVQRVMRNGFAASLMRVPHSSMEALGASQPGDLQHIRMRQNGEFVTPDQLPLQRAVRGENVRDDEYELVFTDGSPSVILLSSASPLRNEAGEITGAVAVSLDITGRKRVEEARELLARELSHRIKNIFAVVGGLAALSARSYPEAAAFSKSFRDRITALAQAHEYVRPHSPDSRPSPVSETVLGLMGTLLEPYLQAERERVTLRGDDVPIGAKSATSLALIMHEQATNAVKYGALSNETGRVVLTGLREGDIYRLTWQETGGPPVTGTPQRQGFGTLLAARSVAGQLGGEIIHDWAPAGLVVRLTLPVDNLAV